MTKEPKNESPGAAEAVVETYKPKTSTTTNYQTERVWALFERMQLEIAQEIRVLLGEAAYDQRIFTETERQRRIESLQRCAADGTDEVNRHQSWMQAHFEQGWVYGPEFRPDLKQHPNLLPWNQLPASTRSKTRIFAICARFGEIFAQLVNNK